jgi:hypothetical protein
MAGARGRSGASASEQDETQETTDERVTAVVVNDIHCWQEPLPGRPGEFMHMRAYKGNTIKVTPEEFDRGQSLLSQAAPEVAEEITEALENAHGPVDDETLASMNASELIAYVTQNPDEQMRVATFEQGREGGARPEVLQAAGAGEQE